MCRVGRREERLETKFFFERKLAERQVSHHVCVNTYASYFRPYLARFPTADLFFKCKHVSFQKSFAAAARANTSLWAFRQQFARSAQSGLSCSMPLIIINSNCSYQMYILQAANKCAIAEKRSFSHPFFELDKVRARETGLVGDHMPGSGPPKPRSHV